jgi:uncharacterized protein (DUF983 family)
LVVERCLACGEKYIMGRNEAYPAVKCVLNVLRLVLQYADMRENELQVFG